MKVERCGLDRIEHLIRPPMSSSITIPVESNGKEFVIYISVPMYLPPTDKELQDVAKEIADKLEAKPKHLHPFFEK